MRKTVSIAISGQLFHIEEQAYAQLDSYLTSVRSHFRSFEDSDEIVSDIENRIAERFIEKLGKRRTVINEGDVDDLIKHMGTVEDFKEFDEEPAQESTTSTKRKRLYRDTDDVMIAGVASGIAKYFDIDPTIIRLLFVASLLLGGSGILIYIVLWIVLPEAATTTQKLEMRGKSPTIKQMEQLIRENVPEVKKKMNAGWVRKLLHFPFLLIRSVVNALQKMFATFIPTLLRTIGLAILLLSSFGLALLSFIAVMLFTNAWAAYMDIPLRELMGSNMYELAVVSGYFVVFFPLIALLFAGSSLLVMRNNFRLPAMLVMLGLWIVAITSTAVIVAKDAPVLAAKIEEYIELHKTEVQTIVELEEIESIEVYGGYVVSVDQGQRQDVAVTGSQRGWDAMDMTVEDGVLRIQKKSDHWFCVICLTDTMTVDLTLPELQNIQLHAGARLSVDSTPIRGSLVEVHGGSRMVSTNAQIADQLMLDVNGGSRLELTTITPNAGLSASASGGSRIVLTGEAQTLTGSVTGGARLQAEEFIVERADVHVSGGARAEVNAPIITGSVYGGGRVHYPENADVSALEVEVSGSVREFE